MVRLLVEMKLLKEEVDASTFFRNDFLPE